MRFWDTSALLPLILDEESSDTVANLLRQDTDITVWWGTRAERAVAISRLRWNGELDEEREESTREVLDVVAETWIEIRPTDDSGFVCLDNRLRQAAQSEGFAVLPESAGIE